MQGMRAIGIAIVMGVIVMAVCADRVDAVEFTAGVDVRASEDIQEMRKVRGTPCKEHRKRTPETRPSTARPGACQTPALSHL